MNNYQQYVYLHVDPQTKEVVYVGTGSGQRAWMMRNSSSSKRYGHRSPKHYQWFLGLQDQGFTLDQIVVLQIKNINKESAKRVEKELIQKWMPKFNIHKGPESMLSPERVKDCKMLRKQGLSYSKIANQLGIATMTAWRNSNARME